LTSTDAVAADIRMPARIRAGGVYPRVRLRAPPLPGLRVWTWDKIASGLGWLFAGPRTEKLCSPINLLQPPPPETPTQLTSRSPKVESPCSTSWVARWLSLTAQRLERSPHSEFQDKLLEAHAPAGWHEIDSEMRHGVRRS
jgi:hypothetical protein